MGLFGESFSDKMLKYFINAIRAYFISGGKSELIAAFASAKTCGKRDRILCIGYLNDMADEYLKEAENAKDNNDEKKLDTFTQIYGHLMSFKDMIEEKDWTIRDSVEEKNNLGSIDPEYLKALKKGDYDVFVRRYPELGS